MGNDSANLTRRLIVDVCCGDLKEGEKRRDERRMKKGEQKGGEGRGEKRRKEIYFGFRNEDQAVSSGGEGPIGDSHRQLQ